MGSFSICKKCGLIQEPSPHVAPWKDPCTNCGGEDFEFVKEQEIKPIEPSICPKCQSKSIGKFVYGPPELIMVRYQKELAKGKIRAAGCIFSQDNHHWFCRDCDYEW